jgi:ABC-type glutathione transport system ATPase component
VSAKSMEGSKQILNGIKLMSPESLVLPQITNQPVLAGRNISKIYRSGDLEVNALRGVNFELYAKDMVVLLGTSGRYFMAIKILARLTIANSHVFAETMWVLYSSSIISFPV